MVFQSHTFKFTSQSFTPSSYHAVFFSLRVLTVTTITSDNANAVQFIRIERKKRHLRREQDNEGKLMRGREEKLIWNNENKLVPVNVLYEDKKLSTFLIF